MPPKSALRARLRSILLVASLVAASLAAGCATQASGARLALYVKDAPVEGAESVNVTFVAVQVLPEGGGEWITVFEGNESIDLLALNGTDARALLADVTLPPGDYSQLLLAVSDAVVGYANGTSETLNVTDNVVSLATNFTVGGDAPLELLVDIDLDAGVDGANGTFAPAVRDVQSSAVDSDGDGIPDFSDSDDDDDGTEDAADEDRDGNGLADALEVVQGFAKTKNPRALGTQESFHEAIRERQREKREEQAAKHAAFRDAHEAWKRGRGAPGDAGPRGDDNSSAENRTSPGRVREDRKDAREEGKGPRAEGNATREERKHTREERKDARERQEHGGAAQRNATERADRKDAGGAADERAAGHGRPARDRSADGEGDEPR